MGASELLLTSHVVVVVFLYPFPILQSMTEVVLGIFDNRADADTAIDDLKEADFNPKDISIVMRDSREVQHRDVQSPVAEGAISGAATGGVLGGIAGLLIGIGAIAIPGVGAILIGGPLAAALGISGVAATTVSGAATGVVAGGIVGALVTMGIPEEEAKGYEKSISQGAILVAVNASSEDAEAARNIFDDNNAKKVRTLTV